MEPPVAIGGAGVARDSPAEPAALPLEVQDIDGAGRGGRGAAEAEVDSGPPVLIGRVIAGGWLGGIGDEPAPVPAPAAAAAADSGPPVGAAAVAIGGASAKPPTAEPQPRAKPAAVRQPIKSVLAALVAKPNIEVTDITQDYKNLRELIDSQFKHIKLNVHRANAYVKVLKVNREAAGLYRELILYLAFSALFLFLVLSIIPLNINTQQDSALAAPGGFLNYVQLGADQTAFSAMNTFEQFYAYVRNILLPLLNVDDTSSFQWTRKRVGTIRLRQARVRGYTCPAVDPKTMLFQPSEACFAEYQWSEIDTSAAPNANRTTWSSTLTQLRPSEKYLRDGSPFWSYGTAGFFVDLPISLADADATIQALIDNRWIDESTRAVAASFSLQNPQTATYTVVDMVAEVPPSGTLLPSINVNTLKLQPLESGPVLAVGIVFMVFVLVDLVLECRQLSELGFSDYLNALWNAWDIAQLVLIIWLYARVGEYARFSRDMAGELATRPDPARFYDFGRGLELMREIQQVAGIALLVTFLRMFKFFELNTYLSVLTNTLWKAVPELSAILAIFSVLFSGYALMAWVMFGYKVNEFRSFHASLSTLFGNIGGGFQYDDLADAAPGGAVVFFFSFIVVISLVTVNIFIAIVNKYYVIADKTAIERGYVVDDETMEELGEEARLGTFHKFRKISGRVHVMEMKPPKGSPEADKAQAPADAKKASSSATRVRVWLSRRPRSAAAPDNPPADAGAGSALPRNPSSFGDAAMSKAHIDVRAKGKDVWKLFLREILESGDLLTIVPPPDLKTSSCLLRVDKLSNSKEGFYMDCDLLGGDGAEAIVDEAAIVLPKWTLLKRLVMNYIRNLSSSRAHRLAGQLFAESGVSAPAAFLMEDEEMEKQILRIASMNQKLRQRADDARPRTLYSLDDMLQAIRSVEEARDKATKMHEADGNDGEILTWLNEKFVGVMLNESIRIDSMHKELLGLQKQLQPGQDRNATYLRTASLHKELAEASRSFYRWIEELHVSIAGDRAKMVIEGLRFDEVCDLIRDSLMRSDRTGFNEVDIKKEAVRFLSAFPNSCFDTVEVAREAGQVYVPRPYDTKQIEGTGRDPAKFLSEEIKKQLGTVVHDIWAFSKLQGGWSYGETRDNNAKKHPMLKPLEKLSKGDAQNDIDTAVQTLQAVAMFGYDLRRRPASGGDFDNKRALIPMQGQKEYTYFDDGERKRYVLQEVDKSSVRETEDVRELIELLAKNVHDRWAKDLKAKGWTYGKTVDDDKLQHNLMLPFNLLEEKDKKPDRDAVRMTIMSILGLGWEIKPHNR